MPEIKTIYQKLAEARVELQDLKLKKTGKNQSMSYYELADFLPAIVKLCEKHGMITIFNMSKAYDTETAELTIRDTVTGTSVCFVSPTGEANLPKGQAIQNLGAKITYMRRYMLMTAFELIESDIVDKVNKQLENEITEDDMKLIEGCKTKEELSLVFSELQKKYKMSLLAPIIKEVGNGLREEDANE